MFTSLPMTNLRHSIYPDRELPPGEWLSEPDKITWYFPKYHLMGMISRHKRLGHLCGYIGVPSNHPLYGKHYDNAPGLVHGGWTYGAECADHICHNSLPGEPDQVYWFGFDCAHGDDLSPKIPFTYGTYKNIYYVAKEIVNVAPEFSLKVS